MVPLYAARVQDLGPDDVAVFKCGACGHTAELPPSALLRGLGLKPTEQLKPTDKILDLEQRDHGAQQGGLVSRRRKIGGFIPFPSGNHPRCSKAVYVSVLVTSTSGFDRLLLATKAICR